MIPTVYNFVVRSVKVGHCNSPLTFVPCGYKTIGFKRPVCQCVWEWGGGGIELEHNVHTGSGQM